MAHDGWSVGYADHGFNQPTKFPDPRAMIDQVHRLGFKFGLWDTCVTGRQESSYANSEGKTCIDHVS